MKPIFVFVFIFILFTSFSSFAHEWKQMYILAEPSVSNTTDKDKKFPSINITVLFDATYAVPELRDDPSSGAQPIEWLELSSKEQHAEMQQEAARILGQVIELNYALPNEATNDSHERLYPSYRFPDWDSTPPTFPKTLGKLAYFNVTFNIKHLPNKFLYLKVTDHPLSTNILLEAHSSQLPESFTTIKKGDSVCLTHLLNINFSNQPDLKTTTGFKNTQLKSLWNAFTLGITHVIPSGIDHVLFIIALGLAANSTKRAIKFALIFTLAHMITFSAVYSGLIYPPNWLNNITEIAILGSIILMAALNLKGNQNDKQNEKQLWPIFLFGIIHGLGFGSALQSGSTSLSLEIIPTLLFINLGIDLAQLGIIALLLIVMAVFPKKKKKIKLSINIAVLYLTICIIALRAFQL